MTEQTIRCPICGEPYKFYAYMAGDQSACPKCRKKATRYELPEKDWNAFCVKLDEPPERNSRA